MTGDCFGSATAPIVLIQAVDGHDLPAMEHEVRLIRELSGADFALLAVKVEDWNRDLSPWPAPAVFGTEDFGGGAAGTLRAIEDLRADDGRTYVLGGYSLAGLFALWAAYQTDAFAGVAAASPSIWFPGFAAYMQGHRPRSRAVYLSLGDREERTRNPVTATVGDSIRAGYAVLREQGVNARLEWNPGNHFKDADLRCARAFAWVLRELAGTG